MVLRTQRPRREGHRAVGQLTKTTASDAAFYLLEGDICKTLPLDTEVGIKGGLNRPTPCVLAYLEPLLISP